MPTDSAPPARRAGRDSASKLLEAAEVMVAPARRLERSPVLGPRATRTRQSLVDSASQLFEERGFVNTTVLDIAERSGVSLATFYQYFKDLNSVVGVLVVEFIRASLARGLDRWDIRAGRAGLRENIANFAGTYVEFRNFLETWACVELIDPEMRALSRRYRAVYMHRCYEYLLEGVELGLVRPDLDVEGAADAMTVLVERSCFESFVFEKRTSEAEVVALVDRLTDLWAGAIGLEAVPAPADR